MNAPKPTHYCPTLHCKLMPERCEQRRNTKQKLKNPYMLEYGAYYKDCRDCKGPVKLSEEVSK